MNLIGGGSLTELHEVLVPFSYIEKIINCAKLKFDTFMWGAS